MQVNPEKRQDLRISYIGVLILITLTLLAGVSVYLVMVQQSKEVLGRSLGTLLQGKIQVFSQEIDRSQGLGSREANAYRPLMKMAIQKISRAPNDSSAKQTLQRVMGLLLKENFLAISVYGVDDQELISVGKMVTEPALGIPLKTDYPSFLMWNRQFVMRASTDVFDQGKRVGRVVTEMAMPKLTHSFNNIKNVGKTGEFALCQSNDKDALTMQCFLNGFQQDSPFFEGQARVVNGAPLPMDHALKGETGLIFARDYRGESVVAAYAPVSTLGLGMVLKLDQEELYGPVISRLKYIVPILVALVLIGALLLRWLLMPLVRNLVASEQAAKSTSLRLAKSRTRYRLVLDHSPYCIHEIDQKGNVVSMNPAGLKMNDVKSEKEIMGTPFIEGIAEKDKIRVASLMGAGLRGNQSEFEFTGVSGRMYHSSFVPIEDVENNVLRLMGWTQDITLAKQHAEQLQRSQKMDALGKLTGGISHDFNNLLGIILGYTELLEESLADQPKLASFAQEIQKAGVRGAKLTKRLLGFSQYSHTDAQTLDINVLLRDMQYMLQQTLTARVVLQLSLFEPLWLTELDKSALEDAIVNISINAMHAIEGPGRLIVETENVCLNMAAAHSLNLAPGDYVKLSMTDTGCGMDAETLDKVFDPFFSTKGDMGTGLGLSQVHSFVERSGGSVDVSSETGKGACFMLYFARGHERVVETYSAGNNEMAAFQGSETILVVDDELDLMMLTARLLERCGYRVFCASSGIVALELLKREQIDLMLSDVIMPEMDGFELAVIVGKLYPKLKIQLASGYTDSPQSQNIGDLMGDDLLHKPYHSHLLYKRMRELLAD